MDARYDESLSAMLSASLSMSGLGPTINSEQASALLACSEAHVEKMAECGRLPGTKFGRGWIFVTAQLLHHVITECAGNLRAIGADPAEFTTSTSQPPTVLEQPSSPLPTEPQQSPKRRGRPRRPLSDAPWFNQTPVTATASNAPPAGTDFSQSKMSASSEPRKLK